MGYLKSGISRCVAVLSACGVVTVSAVTFATLDKNVIQPCAVMPPENAKVISAVSDKETSEQIGGYHNCSYNISRQRKLRKILRPRL